MMIKNEQSKIKYDQQQLQPTTKQTVRVYCMRVGELYIIYT